MNDPSDPLQLRDDDLVRIGDDVVCTELPDDEAVLLHVGTRRIFRLNGSGLAIWKLLSQGRPLGEIAGEIQRTFDIPGTQASGDVSDLVTEMIAEGLVALDSGVASEPPTGSQG